nr:hypothetical protein [Tanacetum cinerariifolium]
MKEILAKFIDEGDLLESLSFVEFHLHDLDPSCFIVLSYQLKYNSKQRPFLATARVMIDVFNKNIMLMVGDDEVIFDMDQSTKNPPTEDDECHGIDDLDDTINIENQELLGNDQLDPFLLKGWFQSDLKSYSSIGYEFDNNSDVDFSIRCINPVNMSYSEAQETEGTNRDNNKHLYLASANEIDKKKPD